jgi:hypothetical protein
MKQILKQRSGAASLQGLQVTLETSSEGHVKKEAKTQEEVKLQFIVCWGLHQPRVVVRLGSSFAVG